MTRKIKLLSLYFEDDAFIDKSSTWIEWFVYENDFGRGGLSAFLNKIEYNFANAGEFYDFYIKWKKD